MPKQMYTAEQLMQAVRTSTTVTQVVQKLGLVYNSQTHIRVRNNIVKYNIDRSHFNDRMPERLPMHWTVEQLRTAIATSYSLGEVVRKLAITGSGTARKTLKRHIENHRISTAHFLSQRQGFNPRTRPIQDYLIDNGANPISIDNTRLKQRLIKEGFLKNECAICKQLPIWQEKPLVLHLDHINGHHPDNQLHNLRILCPHCHTQTETYCRRTER